MDINSNKYTFIFSTVMVVVVGSLLAIAAVGLKPFQSENVKREKMQNILSSVGITVTAEEAGDKFNQYITDQIIINGNGEVKETDLKAFDVDVLKDYKSGMSNIYSANKDDEAAMRKALMSFGKGGANFPLFVYSGDDGSKKYIVPMVGKGLWGPIWGYVAINSDGNTVAGATFDHKTETPGLGAEIKEGWFSEPFIGKKLFDENGNYVSVSVVKGGAPEDDMHGVDAISGGTITSNGVSEMVYRTLKIYEPYFKSLNNSVAKVEEPEVEIPVSDSLTTDSLVVDTLNNQIN